MNLKHFVDTFTPDLVFISEPQAFQCDIQALFDPFVGDYGYYLNSEDVMCPDLPLEKSKANGGTMIMWREKLTPYIKIINVSSSSFLPFIISIPGVATSAHIVLYLPTSGKETEFISALASLDACLEVIKEDYACPIYLRGDANVNPNNTARTSIFTHFCKKHALLSLDLCHPTHHHFQGEGLFDAQLDLLLYSGPSEHSEHLSSIVCKLQNPLVESHHDIVVSSFSLPQVITSLDSKENVVAPKVLNDRVKILWDSENIPYYQSLLASNLTNIRDLWSNPSSPSSISILLSSTNDALSSAAKISNKYILLSKEVKPRSVEHPEIRAAQSNLLEANIHLTPFLTCKPLRSLGLLSLQPRALSNASPGHSRLNYQGPGIRNCLPFLKRIHLKYLNQLNQADHLPKARFRNYM